VSEARANGQSVQRHFNHFTNCRDGYAVLRIDYLAFGVADACKLSANQSSLRYGRTVGQLPRVGPFGIDHLGPFTTLKSATTASSA